MSSASLQRAGRESRTAAKRKKTRTNSRETNASPVAAPLEEIRDYVAVADRFARDAVADVAGARHCRWVRLAAARYLRDRDRARSASPPFAFSPAEANNACDFIEKLPHVEGRWESPTITLHPAHVFFVVNLFGFRQHDGTRRFTVALFSTARKNAKSTIAAAILLYCFCCEDEPGPQVISAATTGSQARIVFNIAKRMVEMTPDLRAGLVLAAEAIEEDRRRDRRLRVFPRR